MASMQTIGKTATTIRTDPNGWTNITYHATTVVTFNNRYVILRTGGWRTATTKARMNQASNQYGLGYQVSQMDFKWYVNDEEMKGSKIIIDRKTGKILYNALDSKCKKWIDVLKKIGYFTP